MNTELYEQLQIPLIDVIKYQEFIEKVKTKNNIIEMLFSLMETNAIFGYEYRTDFDTLISELRFNDSIWDQKIASIFNMSYEELNKKISNMRIDNVTIEQYNIITNIINKAENDHNQLLKSLGKLHASKTINDKKIILNYFNMRALSFYIYNNEKEKLGLKPSLIVEDSQDGYSTKFVKIGSFSIFRNGKTISQIIKINVGHILDNYYGDREECIYELMDTIHHEIRHSQIYNMAKSVNVYNVDVLHAAMDSLIGTAGRSIKGHQNYYFDNYHNIKEERMARIYGHQKAIENIQTFKKNISKIVINKKIAELRKEEALFIIKNTNEIKSNRDSFITSNQLADILIVSNPSILQTSSILSHVYFPDGKRKSVDVLMSQRQVIIKCIAEEMDRIYNSDIPISEKANKYRSLAIEIKEVKKFYDEIIYLALKKLTFEQYKKMSCFHEELAKSIDNVLMEREMRIYNNDEAYKQYIISFDDWFVNNNSIIEDYNNISREKNRLNNFINTFKIEKRYTR